MTVDYRINCWGDSLTLGFQAGPGNDYPTQLKNMLGRPTFNYGVGGYKSADILTAMSAKPSQFNWTAMLWAGKNNATDPLADVQSMVSNLGHNRYIVFAVPNSRDGTEDIGMAAYRATININNEYAANFPNNYIDVRTLLIQNADPNNATDQNDVALDRPPSTLMYSDNVHMNGAGFTVIATAVANFIRNWTDIKYGSWRLR